MTIDNLVEFSMTLYTKILEIALPIGFVFGMCNVIVSTCLSVAFGGRFIFRSGDK